MSFLAPAALWFSLVGLGIVALYLLKIKRRREEVPSLEFWRQLAPETQVRSLFQRLKRLLSLLLWLLTAACLVLALANPILTSGRMKAETIAVIFDNSASMQTVEQKHDDKTRFALASEAVRELIARRPVNDEWLLIESGIRPHVVQAFTRDHREILEGIESLSPRFGSGDLKKAVELASQLLEGKPEARILIVSDGASGRVRDLSASDDRIMHWPIGESKDNLGITRMSVRTQRQNSEHHVYLQIINAGPETVETNVVFTIDGTTTKVEPVSIAAGDLWEKTVVFQHPEGGVLTASLDREDALQVDNRAYAILAPVDPVTVFLVTPPKDAYFFEQVLVAMESLVDAETSQTLSPDDYEKMGALRERADLTIFNNYVPQARPANGRAIFVNRWSTEIPAKQLGEHTGTRMEVVQSDHPLMRFLNFGAVTITRAQQIEVSDDVQVLSRASDDSPLIFLYQTPEIHALCLAFDILDSDLPFRNSFPILLRNAVSYFVTEQTPWVRSDYKIGEIVESLRPLSDELHMITVGVLENGQLATLPIPVQGNSFWFDRTENSGPLRFEIGEEIAYSAVNLNDEFESRIAPVPPTEQVEHRLVLSTQIAGVTPWLAFALCGTLLICMEWFTYHSRWTE